MTRGVIFNVENDPGVIFQQGHFFNVTPGFFVQYFDILTWNMVYEFWFHILHIMYNFCRA